MATSVDWGKVSLPRFAVVGTAYTLALEAAVFPMFSIATRLQFERETRVQFFRDAWRVLRSHTVRSLYRGFGVYVIGGLPSQGVYYGGYNVAKHYLGVKNTDSVGSKAAMHATAALVADVVATPLWAPFDVIAKTMVVRGGANETFRTFRSTVRHIYKTDGPRGYFRGMSALLWTYLPTSMAWWSTYEFSKDGLVGLRQRHADSMPMPAVHMAAGATAGFVAALVSNPFSLATTRLQTQQTSSAAAASSGAQATVEAQPRDRNLLQALRSIVRHEGPLALWRGLIARLTHSTIASGLSFTVYEQVLRLSVVDSDECSRDA